MRRLFIVFSAVCFAVACNNSKTTLPHPNDDTAQTNANNPANAEEQTGLELVASHDCFSCHKVADQLVGPAYEQVAERYKDSSDAIVDTLTNRVIRGSSGHWGEAQMTPHPNIPEQDVRSMVNYVLSLK
jgi:cytochrome c